MPQAATAMRTCPGPGAGGSASSVTVNSPSRYPTARIDSRSCRGGFAVVVGVGLGDRGDQSADETVAVILGVLQTRLAAEVAPPEVWNHLRGEQFVAAFGVLPVGHVDMQDQQGAEAAGLVEEPLDLRDRLVRCPDDGLAEFAEAVVAPVVDDPPTGFGPLGSLPGLAVHIRRHR